jgi:hypothetical protein
MQRRMGGHRVAPTPPGSAEPSRSPAQANRTATLEANLEQLETSQQLAAENERLTLLEAHRAHEMTMIQAALQRATSAAESSRDRSERDQAAIKRLNAALTTALIRAQPAEPTYQSPTATARVNELPPSPSPAPHVDMVNELRLLRSEMETAQRARQSAPMEKSEREVALLEQLREMEQKLATSQHDLAEERHKLEKSHVDEDSLRRKVVEEMSANWGGISKVVESALLGSTVHSEGAEKALKKAASIAHEAGTARESAAGGGNSTDDEAGSGAVASKNPEWSGADWMASQSVAKLIADTLFARAGGANLPFLRALAEDVENGKDAITALLRVGLLEKLSDCIWEGSQKLVQSRAASGVALHEKFVSEGDTFKLNYGGLVRASLMGPWGGGGG